jgi:hypothetical protein
MGATFAHNHPLGSGPSKEDVSLAIEYGLHEVRVVTRLHRFIVNSFGHIQVAAFDAEYASTFPKVIQTLRGEVLSGQLNKNDFHAELVHRTLQRTASALGFWYERQQS